MSQSENYRARSLAHPLTNKAVVGRLARLTITSLRVALKGTFVTDLPPRMRACFRKIRPC